MASAIDEQALLAQLVQSPRLPLLTRQLDQLVADEAARRQEFYNQISEDDKAEYINGEIIFHSPAKFEHNDASGHLYRLLSTYVMLRGLGYVGYEKIMISLTRNDYEPDICFFGSATSELFDRKQMQFPAPDLIIEILSPSTESNDRGIKFQDYALHGVQEYWLVDPDLQVLEQYELRNESYELILKSGSGYVTSLVLPNFTIPIRAVFDETLNGEALRSIIAAGNAG